MGYQPKKSTPPEKRNPPKGGSNVTPLPNNRDNVFSSSVVSCTAGESISDDSTLDEIMEEITEFVSED